MAPKRFALRSQMARRVGCNGAERDRPVARRRSRIPFASLGLGAALMYLLDPEHGRRRRAELRDRSSHLVRKGGHLGATVARNLGNHLRGYVAEMQARATGGQVPDDVLVERVRSKLGHVVQHPGAIEATASNGLVTLTGGALPDEIDKLTDKVGMIRGVVSVDNRLEGRIWGTNGQILESAPSGV